jgi:tRNA(Ile)-lysidine synthase
MNYSLEQHVAKFMNAHWDKRRGVLLAFSGGPDSLALLHLLLFFCKHQSLTLALAHVDHGWRKESKEEADQIAEIAKQLGLTLHIATLDPKEMQGNLEAACREARLKFFAHLCSTYSYQAVLMAHHADDMAETVLKRILEGSSLTYLTGLSPTSELYGVHVWRPLLDITKKELIHWLSTRSLKGFEDHTNYDPRFLRARIRTKIIPQLSEIFGKEVSAGLCRIGLDSAELRQYLDNKVNAFLGRIVVGPFGKLLDLSRDCPESLIEVKYLIRRICENEGFTLSRESVDIAAHRVIEGSADKQIAEGDKHVYVDRGRIFIVRNQFCKLPSEALVLKPGEWKFGLWTVQVSLTDMPSDCCSNWRSLWQGEGEVTLPFSDYHLKIPYLNVIYPGSSPISKWWTNHKIPAFMRMHVPIIYWGEKVMHEFLSGKVITKISAKKYINIKLIS